MSGIQFSYTPIEYLVLRILIRLVMGNVPAFLQKSVVWGKNDPPGWGLYQGQTQILTLRPSERHTPASESENQLFSPVQVDS